LTSLSLTSGKDDVYRMNDLLHWRFSTVDFGPYNGVWMTMERSGHKDWIYDLGKELICPIWSAELLLENEKHFPFSWVDKYAKSYVVLKSGCEWHAVWVSQSHQSLAWSAVITFACTSSFTRCCTFCQPVIFNAAAALHTCFQSNVCTA